jgi:predicted CoA-binding protein
MTAEHRPNPDQDGIRDILTQARTIAVVGLSPDPARDSHRVAAYLIEHGYRVIPVNPKEQTILGQKVYPDLAAIPEPVDVVDVFRASEHVPPIAEAATRLGAKALWLQLGVRHDEAARKAAGAGLAVVQDLCIKVEHHCLLGRRK